MIGGWRDGLALNSEKINQIVFIDSEINMH